MDKKIIFQKCNFNYIYFIFFLVSIIISTLIEENIGEEQQDDEKKQIYDAAENLLILYISGISDFLAIIPFFLFSIIYLVIVFKEKLRERWLSGLKAIYFYLIASIGQIIGLCIYYVAYILKWYSPYYEYTGFMWDFLGYKTYIGKEGDSVLLNGMFELAIYMAIPFVVLVVIEALRSVNRMR